MDKLIYLDGVQDPGNLGTIIRSANAFDCDWAWKQSLPQTRKR